MPRDEDTLADVRGRGFNLFTDPSNDDNFQQSKYDFSYRTFPADIASQGTHHQHYMVININVRDAVAFGGGATRYRDSIQTPDGNVATFKVTEDEMSKQDILRFNLDPQYKSKTGDPLGSSGNLLPRFTRRIVESIAIFMPQSVQYTNSHEYEAISVLTLGTEVAGSIVNRGPTPQLGGFAGLFLNGVAGLIERGGNLGQMAQTQLNPMTEVLYRTTPQRTFVFDFLMAPSNLAESDALDQIHRTLRFHAAPEYADFLSVPFLKAPSEFDITFYHKGQENTSIPRINTCVLTQIDLDFSPTGIYATFKNGAPVMARMTLQFRELEAITKLRVAQGF
jgi:hypothetical protein